MEGAPPTCKSDFLTNWKRAHPLDEKDEAKRRRNISCTSVVRQMVEYAEKTVRHLHCDSGDGNAYFQSKTAFATVNHTFTGGGVKLPASMLETCYVEQKRLDPRTKLKISFQIPVNYGDDQLKLGDRSGANDDAGDFAVTTVKMPLEEIDASPAPLASFDEINRTIEKEGPVEFFMMSAFAPSEQTANGCFAVTQCSGIGPNFPSEDQASSIYVNNCPSIQGFSGSPIFILQRDRDGMCIGFAAVGLLRGGRDLKERNGNSVFEPPGRPFHFDPKNMNSDNVGNNYTVAVGFDNVFRSWLAEAAKIKLTEQVTPPVPLKPAGDNL
jgi:hypothetical protein